MGFTAFGGPLAIIAQIQRDLVDKQKLITEEEFKKSLALIKTLPGPTAAQVLTFIAYRLGGFWTAFFSLSFFILPSALMMVGLAIYYDKFRANAEILNLLEGMQAGAFVLIVMALYSLTKGNFTQNRFWVLFVISLLVLGPLKIFEPFVIIGAGVFSLFLNFKPRPLKLSSYIGLDLFLICLKAGGLAFGTGFAILPLLQKDFVEVQHWVTKDQFMDALSFGQLTPGPISVTVTFVGYRLAGWLGALVATVGIFLPGFFNMTTWFPRAYNWFSRQVWVNSFSVGATAAIAAGIVIVLLSLLETIRGPQLIIPFLLLGLSFRRNIPSWALVVISGLSWWLVSHAILEKSLL